MKSVELDKFTENEVNYLKTISKPNSKLTIILIIVFLSFNLYFFDFLKFLFYNYRLLEDTQTNGIAHSFFYVGLVFGIVGVGFSGKLPSKNHKKIITSRLRISNPLKTALIL